jgi:hypothetical protein
MKAKVVFWIGTLWSKKVLKNHLGTFRLHLVRTITIRGAILVKIKIFNAENASFQGYFTEVFFDPTKGNWLSYFQNGYFFKILW